jgi:hypothetical protein
MVCPWPLTEKEAHMFEIIVTAMGVCRVILGLAPFLAIRISSRLLGIPKEHDTPSARLMARLFGTRDVGLGVLVFWALQVSPTSLGFVLVFNAITDLGDLIAIAIPLLRRQGIDRLAWTSAGFAAPACIAWLIAFALRG